MITKYYNLSDLALLLGYIPIELNTFPKLFAETLQLPKFFAYFPFYIYLSNFKHAKLLHIYQLTIKFR